MSKNTEKKDIVKSKIYFPSFSKVLKISFIAFLFILFSTGFFYGVNILVSKFVQRLILLFV